MPGIVVVRGVVLVAPLDKVCESPGEGVSVALLVGCSCLITLVADGGPPFGPPLGDGVERCRFGGRSIIRTSRFSAPADAYGCGRNPGAEWWGGGG